MPDAFPPIFTYRHDEIGPAIIGGRIYRGSAIPELHGAYVFADMAGTLFALGAGDEVVRTKPHPDPYLFAAAGLGADPARCAVIEDTATGVASAEAAGCHVVAVPSVSPITPADRRTVVTSLEEVDLAFLRGLMVN